jgi:hypothetical protein
VVRQVDAGSLTVTARGEKALGGDRVVKLAAAGKVTVNGKPAKLADLQPGDRVTVTLTADGSAALAITSGGR